jgi:eukaryotic-like serine/threonine-protein kinase
LGPYQIINRVGAGGMGEVYKATDTRLGRSVAIKTLGAEFATRFEREARAISALNHPHICQLYDVGPDYLVMEFIEGVSLRGPLPVDTALRYAVQIADALTAAHAKGITHRDLKPGNIMVTASGIKLLDFGLAQFSRADGSPSAATNATAAGTILGTIAYMSPEQAEGKAVDARSDVFSFGVVLYEMLSGRRAFGGASTYATVAAILHKEPEALNAPVALQAIVERCLRKSPADRFQSMTEVKEELLAVGDALRSSRGAPSPPRWAQVSGVVLVAITAILGYLYTRPIAPPRALQSVQLTSTIEPKYDSRGWMAEGDLVTDGARVYFTTTVEGQPIAQVSSAGGETLPLPFRASAGNGYAVNLFGFSPNGSELMLVSFDGTKIEGPLQTLAAVGGAPRRVGRLLVHSATWSPDGTRIAYSNGNEVFLANADGSESRRLFTTPEITRNLRWSPDGAVLRFTMNDSKTGGRSIWQVSVDGSNFHPLLPGWSKHPNESAGSWTPDGRYFVFQAVQDGTVSLWARREGAGFFRRASSAPVQLTAGPLNMGVPMPSRDGRKIFAIGWQPRAELARYDAKLGKFTPYLSGLSATNASFSRDKQWIAYLDFATGALWRSKVDGTEKLQLTFPPMQAFLPRWSPDGSQIAFVGDPGGERFQIYIVSAAGGSPEQVYRSETAVMDPGWSPDGKSLVFSDDPFANKSATQAVYVLDLTTRHASKVAGSEGLFSPRWSPDGRYLAAMTADSLNLKLFDFAAQKWTEILSNTSVAYPNWSQDGNYIFSVVYGAGAAPSYCRTRVSDRKVNQIADLSGRRGASGRFGAWIGLTPDESPLIARDNSIREVYALDWEAP